MLGPSSTPFLLSPPLGDPWGQVLGWGREGAGPWAPGQDGAESQCVCAQVLIET